MEKSTPVIERLKAGKVPKFTVCGKQFQTLMTLSIKNLLRTLQLNALRMSPGFGNRRTLCLLGQTQYLTCNHLLFKLTTYRKAHIASPMVKRQMTSRDHKGQCRDPKIFEGQYLNNRARYMVDSCWLPIGNHILGVQWSRDRRCHLSQNNGDSLRLGVC